MAATRFTSARACSSETPGLRRAYAKYRPAPRFESLGDRNERNPHLGVAAAAEAGDRQPERRWHDAAHGIGPPVERDGAADDVAPAAKAPPERARDDGAAVVGEPLAEER